ncbi:U6 snRNA-associated Sm-like protein LSm1 isoform 2-T2 [Ciconia maguari]
MGFERGDAALPVGPGQFRGRGERTAGLRPPLPTYPGGGAVPVTPVRWDTRLPLGGGGGGGREGGQPPGPARPGPALLRGTAPAGSQRRGGARPARARAPRGSAPAPLRPEGTQTAVPPPRPRRPGDGQRAGSSPGGSAQRPEIGAGRLPPRRPRAAPAVTCAAGGRGDPGGPRRARIGGAAAGLHGRRPAPSRRQWPPPAPPPIGGQAAPAPTNGRPPRAHGRRGLKGQRRGGPRPAAGRFRGGGGGTGAWRRFRWGRRGGTMNYMPGTASLIQDIDKKHLVLLRDGRTLIGFLRSIDQFANLVLHQTVERIHVGKKYGDIPRGIFVVRGENVVLLGEIGEPKRSQDQIPRLPSSR